MSGGDWVGEMSEEQRAAWDEFVESTRRGGLIEMIQESHIFLTIAPEDADVKFAVELGFAIMIDKPIMTVVMPNRVVPEHLVRVSDLIVHADIDTEEGRAKLEHAIMKFRVQQMKQEP